MTSLPKTETGDALGLILRRCGVLCADTAPEELVTLCRKLEAERDELREQMREAWKLVDAMAGQEYWDRAEEWLAKNLIYSHSSEIEGCCKSCGSKPCICEAIETHGRGA